MINGWVNGHIRQVEDQQLYRRADYWADARETLQTGLGDCEDIALLKMQMLASAGISRSNMYFVIAYDLVRRRDHALLVVRDGEQYWLLDNASTSVVDARSGDLGYRPILSFSSEGKWLHGY